MVRRSLLCFWTQFFKVITAEFQPKVTKTTIDDPERLTIFDNSTTLLKLQGEALFISSDNSANWEKSDELYGDIWGIELDEHYRDSRAVAEVDYDLYLTEDQGKHWRNLKLPRELHLPICEVDSHPFEKDYFLLRCEIYPEDDDDRYKEYSYVSNDGGRNLKKIESPISKNLDVTCRFACKSTDSVFSSNKDLIYCLNGQRGPLHTFQSRGDLFYTDDFGNSFKFIDQFKDHMVLSIKVLDSRILAFTSEDKLNKSSPTNLWVSNDGFTSDKAFLPTVLRFPGMYRIIEDGLGRIIITTNLFGMKEERASPTFISDSSGLQFHLLDIGTEDTLVSSSLVTSKTLKGTIRAELKSVTKDSDEKKFGSQHKISVDYGNTWSNLRVIRSPGQRKDLFQCDVEDVENCSLKPFVYGEEYDEGYSPTTGILMTVGKVGKDVSWSNKTMTFISRDGGRSWEVAFEYPCSWAFGDGGNIIVTVPFSGLFNDPPGEFYYSLDQGKNLEEISTRCANTTFGSNLYDLRWLWSQFYH